MNLGKKNYMIYKLKFIAPARNHYKFLKASLHIIPNHITQKNKTLHDTNLSKVLK